MQYRGNPPYYGNLKKEGMKEKLDPIRILDGIITDLKNRSQNQDEMGDSIVLTKLADMLTQVKKQCLFENTNREYVNTLPKQ